MTHRVRHPGNGRGSRRGGDVPGDRPPFARVLGFGENPLLWAIPLGRWGRVRASVHAIVPIWIVAEVLAGARGMQGWSGWMFLVPIVGAFLIIGTMREWARAWWARRWGLAGDRVVLWPLGGLTAMGLNGPGASGASAAAACGGIVLQAALLPVLAGALLALGAEWRDLLAHVLEPGAYVRKVQGVSTFATIVEIAVYWLYSANLITLALHAALPMAPFDLGRIWALVARRRRGVLGGAESALRAGLFAALALFTIAAVTANGRLMAVGVLGAIVTMVEYRAVVFARRPDGDVQIDASDEDPPPPADPEASQEPRDPAPATEDIDAILGKISRQGMAALSEGEREALRRATERSRGDPRSE